MIGFFFPLTLYQTWIFDQNKHRDLYMDRCLPALMASLDRFKLFHADRTYSGIHMVQMENAGMIDYVVIKHSLILNFTVVMLTPSMCINITI